MRWLMMWGIASVMVGCPRAEDGAMDVASDTSLEHHTGGSTEVASVQLMASGVIACANSDARVDSPWDTVSVATQFVTEPALIGGGLAVGDFDGDDRTDLFLPGEHTARLYFNVAGADGPEFEDRSDTHLIDIDISDATGASSVDYDGDGDLDLYVTRWRADNRMLINDGTGVFTDDDGRAGVHGGEWRSLCSAWGDMDGDNDLELVVGNYGRTPSDPLLEDPDEFEKAHQAQLYENIGSGQFVDRSHVQLPTPEVHDAYNFMVAWQDLDGDRQSELLVINDFGWVRPSRLFWNLDGMLEMDDGTAGLEQPISGMGFSLGDFNGDLIPDLVQSSWATASMLLSQGNGTWAESAEERGLVVGLVGEQNQVFGWGTEVVDVDVDGDLDVFMGFGTWSAYAFDPEFQMDAMFIQADDGTLTDQAAEWNMAEQGPTRGVVVTDFNGDGWPDIASRVLGLPTPLYLSRCGEEGWLKVELTWDTRNTFGIGSEIRAISGDQTWVRWMRAGGTGMFSGNAPEVLFGFGAVDSLDRLEVHWPDGETSVFKDVDTRQMLTISRTVSETAE